jgi:hypothetical protein
VVSEAIQLRLVKQHWAVVVAVVLPSLQVVVVVVVVLVLVLMQEDELAQVLQMPLKVMMVVTLKAALVLLLVAEAAPALLVEMVLVGLRVTAAQDMMPVPILHHLVIQATLAEAEADPPHLVIAAALAELAVAEPALKHQEMVQMLLLIPAEVEVLAEQRTQVLYQVVLADQVLLLLDMRCNGDMNG